MSLASPVGDYAELRSIRPSSKIASCPLSPTQIQQILRDACREAVHGIGLVDASSRTWLQLYRPDGTPGAIARHALASSGMTAPVRVRGETVAWVVAEPKPESWAAARDVAEAAASRLAEAWNVANEIDSLAGEIVQVYDALHLMYDLGDTFSTSGDATGGARHILEKIMAVLSSSFGELRLEDGLLVKVGPVTRAGVAQESGYRVSTDLRSGGKRLGRITLCRDRDRQSFTSSDSKLLDGVGTLVAGAIRTAQLHDDLRSHAAALREREARLRAVLDNVAEAIITVDRDGRINSLNRSAEQIFGYDVADVVGQSACVLIPQIFDEHKASNEPVLGPLVEPTIPRLELIGRRKDGTEIVVDLAMSDLPIEGQQDRVVSIRDITSRKRSEELLHHQALYDALTDLPNRNLLHAQLDQLLESGARTGRAFATLLMDLDRFKEVNDTIGHQYGDRVLREVGVRLRSSLRQSDLISRLGGDEFAILLPDATIESACTVAEKIGNVLEEPFEVDGFHLNLGVSVGIALYPQHGTDPDALLRRADIAMYVAKRQQSGFVVYHADDDYHTPDRLRLLGELRSAIANGELVLHYQPQVDLKTREVIRVEALVRWQHPQRGLLMPGQFISLAEQSGLMAPLSRWVIRSALQQCQVWLRNGQHMCVAVNLSAQNLHDRWLPRLIGELLDASGVPGHLLQIEITESSLVMDPGRALNTLQSLSRSGVRISIDDFGTGYSSLAYLRRLPVSEIKIDRSFVHLMAGDPNDEAIVRSIIGLGHDLGLIVVAEGVEDASTWDRLAHLNCDVAQGYFMSRPRHACDLVEWLNIFSRRGR
jgi:diguanylate cyclase (GGDEF)-like protein/PAS domain S-box-containing protein